MNIFTDREHALKWAELVDITGAVESDRNKVNPSFGTSPYLLTAIVSLRDDLKGYVFNGWIDFERLMDDKMKRLSSGEKVVVLLAGNLYNEAYNYNPSDIINKCDGTLIQVSLVAIELRANRIEMKLSTVFE